jgi:hypothetical protein
MHLSEINCEDEITLRHSYCPDHKRIVSGPLCNENGDIENGDIENPIS